MMKQRKMGKREAKARDEYGRACVAWNRMSRAADDLVQQLYYALQRKDRALARYDAAVKRLITGS